MSKYSQSGDFGTVEHFPVNIPTVSLSSTNCILNCGWHKVNDLYFINRPNGIECGLMIFTLSGKGKISLGQKTRIAKSGSIAVLPPNLFHSYCCIKDGEWEFYWCHYSGEHAMNCSNDIVKNGDFLFQFDENMINYLMS